MKRIYAHPNPMWDGGPVVVMAILHYEGECPDKSEDPLITYIHVDNDVEVDYFDLVTKNEDDTYTFTKPTT